MRLFRSTFVRRKSVPESYLVNTQYPLKAPIAVSVYPTADSDHMDSQASLSGTSTGPAQSDIESPHRQAKRPTLSQILANQTPEPWTLKAFTAYAERNLCLENIEFIQDADRYKATYKKVLGGDDRSSSSSLTSLTDRPLFRRTNSANTEKLKEMWTRMILLYIAPSSPKELNIPGDIRAGLIPHNKNAIPPSPKLLEAAVKKVTELIDDSILFPFLNEVQPPTNNVHKGSQASLDESYPERSMSRHGSATSSKDIHRSDPSLPPAKRSPKLGSFTFSKHRASSNVSAKSSAASIAGTTSHSSSVAPALSEDSESAVLSPVASNDPEPAPQTPPTSSDGTSSPITSQRKDASWKRMSTRFGFGRKGPPSSLKDVMEHQSQVTEE